MVASTAKVLPTITARCTTVAQEHASMARKFQQYNHAGKFSQARTCLSLRFWHTTNEAFGITKHLAVAETHNPQLTPAKLQLYTLALPHAALIYSNLHASNLLSFKKGRKHINLIN